MIDILDLARYGQSRVILDALTRAGNRQAQVVQDANDAHRDVERASKLNNELSSYYAILEAINQAQLAYDRALLAIARAVVASDTPFADVENMLTDVVIVSELNLRNAIVAELRAITEEAR